MGRSLKAEKLKTFLIDRVFAFPFLSRKFKLVMKIFLYLLRGVRVELEADEFVKGLDLSSELYT